MDRMRFITKAITTVFLFCETTVAVLALGPTPTPIPTATPFPTETPAPTQTPFQTPTPFPGTTPTPIPTITVTPTPAVTPTPPVFSQIVLFGDSLSDTGNVRDRTGDASGGLVDYPSHTFNYSNGRFTDDNGTDPPAMQFFGVWHEQLAADSLGLAPATFSLGGGSNYAFGGARTTDGTHDEVVVSTPFGDLTITIDDMGKQVDDYLASHTVDPNALYIVWGGANDLKGDFSAANVTATAARATALAGRLINAGAQHIMVPNLPPLGDIPRYSDDPARITALNTASLNYRTELNNDLLSLQGNRVLQGTMPTIYPLDVWASVIRTFSDPAREGFINLTDSAQDNSAVNPDQYAFWDDQHPTTAGHHQLALTAYQTLTTPVTPVSRALNISTRVFINTGDEISIAGFTITGNAPKRILIRGIGPSLAANGVPNALADPVLSLADQGGNILMTNDNWRATQEAEIIATGIPPHNDLESAILVSLPPGFYTSLLSSRDGTTGNSLVEVYDLDSDAGSALANLSTRGFVGGGDDVMIGGLIVGDGATPILVLRAIGPSLAGSGIANPLADPILELHDGNGTLIGSNDNWRDSQLLGANATLLAPTDDHESVIVTTSLVPGSYTAVVRGAGGTSGVALVEAYRIE